MVVGSQNANGTVGRVSVPVGVEEFEVTVVLEADKKLTGKETLQLSVGRVESGVVGLDGVEDCGDGEIERIEGEGICLEDEKTAAYTFVVKVDANYGDSQDYEYEFVGEKGGFKQDFVLAQPAVLSNGV